MDRKWVNLEPFLAKGWSSFHKEFWNPFAHIPFWGWKKLVKLWNPHSSPSPGRSPVGAGGQRQVLVAASREKCTGLGQYCMSLPIPLHSFLPLPRRQSSLELLLKSTKLSQGEMSFFFFFSCGTTKVDLLSRGSSELFSSPQPPSFLKYSVTQSFPGCTHIFVIPARVNE